MQEAVIGSLTLVFMVSLGSSLSHSKAGYADKKAANTGRFTAIPSAILGTVVSGILITALGDIIIKILATMVLVFVIERTTTRMRSKDEEAEEEKPLLENKRNYLVGNAFAGASSGMLGIGGGAILVTINRSILKMDARKAAGTSFLVAATIVPVAIISHIILDGVTGNLIERIGIIPIIIILLGISVGIYSVIYSYYFTSTLRLYYTWKYLSIIVCFVFTLVGIYIVKNHKV